MRRNNIWKFALVVFVVAWSLYEMYPPTPRDLLVEFQGRAVRKDATFTSIMERVAQLQKEKPNRTFGNLKEAIGTNDLTTYFPEFDLKGEKDPNSAILHRLQRESAGKIKLGLDLQGGTSYLVAMDTSKLDTNKADFAASKSVALSHAVEVLRKRVDKLGVAEPIIQTAGPNEILIQLPGLTEDEKDAARTNISKAAFLELRLVHPESRELLAQGIIEPGYEVLKEPTTADGGRKELVSLLVSKKVELTGEHVKSAMMSRHPVTGEPQITFTLDSEGAKIFADVTRKNIDRFLAIVLDGELYSAPRIKGEIPTGQGVIEGRFDEKSATELAQVLENPLKAPVVVKEERDVDPSLGRDSIKSGIRASVIGTIAVSGFMAIYYLFAGMVANFALMLNIVILMGVMCSVGTTLTMPGIAGIVLTSGMAVDANVLIFERIREELAAGKSMRGALAAGYDKAFGTIFDSHFTTLVSSVILIFMGTGPVKGFGVTLTIGVAASLFTALVVTRLIFDFLLAKNLLPRLKMLHLVRASNIDFMRWAKPAFIASWLLIFVGIGYGISRGRDVLGVEFSGGNSTTYAFKEKVSVDKIRESLAKLGFGESMPQYQKDLAGGAETLRVTVRDLGEAKDQNVGQKVREALTQTFPQAGFEMRGQEMVGPTVGKDIRDTAIIAALIAMFGILVYVAFRYEFS